jgi:SulP family sulfate permease
VNADRELFGQGLASIAAGLFGGMPATGAIARTAVNVRSGAKTRAAAAVHAIVLLLVVLVAADVVSAIPLAALAGVLMMTAARMVSLATMRRVLRSGRSSAAVFVVTLFVTVAFDLIVAVGIGLAVAAFFALRALSRMSGAHRDPLPGPSQPGDERIALFHVEGSLFFGAADRLVEEIASEPDVEVVILRLSGLQLVDATGANALAELVLTLERRGATVLIKGVRPEHRELLEQLGVIASLRHPNHLFAELEAALAHARSHVRRSAEDRAG